MVKLNESLSLGMHFTLANGPTWLVVQQIEIILKWIAAHQLLEYVSNFELKHLVKEHTPFILHLNLLFLWFVTPNVTFIEILDTNKWIVDISEYCIWKWFDINIQLYK